MGTHIGFGCRISGAASAKLVYNVFMIATFRETARSVSDLNYGAKIVERSVKEVFWYWYKYVLLFAAIMLFLALGGVSYFTPQLPKIVESKLSQFDLTVKGGKASTHIPQPQIYTDSDLAIILNLAGKPADLDNYKSGALILVDRIIFKNTDSNKIVNTKELKWSDLGDFAITKDTLVSWLMTNKLRILTILLSAVIVLALVFLGLYTLWQIISMAIWAVLFLLVAKILKKKLAYAQVVRLVFYASVISLLIGTLNLVLPSQLLATLSLGAFVFYVCAWIYRLK